VGRSKEEVTMKWQKTLGMGLTLLAVGSGCAVDMDAPHDGADGAIAATTDALTREGLTKAEEALVLKAIDDICGDTWCEGDHNFSFDRLECVKGCGGHAGRCQLTFRVFSYDTDLETGPTYTRSCRTPGFTGFDSLVETFGDYHSLRPAYYDALTECIGRVESRLPG
jgi:hypothetical protein